MNKIKFFVLFSAILFPFTYSFSETKICKIEHLEIDGEITTVSGLFSSGFENQSFVPNNTTNEKWWLSTTNTK